MINVIRYGTHKIKHNDTTHEVKLYSGTGTDKGFCLMISCAGVDTRVWLPSNLIKEHKNGIIITLKGEWLLGTNKLQNYSKEINSSGSFSTKKKLLSENMKDAKKYLDSVDIPINREVINTPSHSYFS